MDYRDLLTTDGRHFAFIDPPFNQNAPDVAAYPPDVTGYYLLEGMRRRFGWASFEGKRLLDLGCGVRFAHTIHNLDLPFGLYAGIDVNADIVGWLQQHLTAPRFRFARLDVSNALYNQNGLSLNANALADLGMTDCDAACMFSVITHQSPPEAQLTFTQLRRVIPAGGKLYFTAFTDDNLDRYAERDETRPGHRSTYNPGMLLDILEDTAWRVLAIYPKDNMQQTVFVCAAV